MSANDWHFTPPENKESLEKTLSYLTENQDFMLETIKNGIQDLDDLCRCEKPFNRAVKRCYKKGTVEIFLNHLDSTDPVVHGDFQIGYPGEGIPELAMYRIGYQIVKGYIKENPDAMLEEWTNISSEEMLEESPF
ncbi:Predicted Zn-dependent protease [Halobacillus dabanensis]|uniref:Predicted Zn-dependent protease n=1 Tax=Halobacillus dabanensis TaxID=240302 RepID=A0A1I3TH06_HALDA|nr:DUF2268 domain-containing putative Zn-dependent protease [Halobacillus dabanensis]SFJ69719.1 Predicted Zn-dependent protease [Halobacillus dabanensis]